MTETEELGLIRMNLVYRAKALRTGLFSGKPLHMWKVWAAAILGTTLIAPATTFGTDNQRCVLIDCVVLIR